ncbi:hypothetical protein ACF1DV_29785 [Streptomyces achromogenes]|uniref:hypothetical protein n=1 Tax=Streptomyces achromogenes TaxID=67255 RepID=UPI003700B65A
MVDAMRWRREKGARQETARREVYTGYLVALAKWRNGLREVAYNPSLTPEQRWETARQALPYSQAYEKRMEMFITAPPEVVRHSEAAYKSLRNMKDPIANGLLQDDPEYRILVSAFESKLQSLRSAMRADLGVADPEAGIGFPGVVP